MTFSMTYAFVRNLRIFLIFALFSPEEVVATAAEDVKFLNMYGTDVNTSGIWQRARDLASDTEKLKKISYDAHMSVWPYYRGDVHIDTAFVINEMLTFPGTDFADIRVDLIGYKLAGLPKVTFYLTKGLKLDCVYFATKIRKAGPKWKLKIHVCDLPL